MDIIALLCVVFGSFFALLTSLQLLTLKAIMSQGKKIVRLETKFDCHMKMSHCDSEDVEDLDCENYIIDTKK